MFAAGRYISKDTWFAAGGKGFQPRVHYFVGGAPKMNGTASPALDAVRAGGAENRRGSDCDRGLARTGLASA